MESRGLEQPPNGPDLLYLSVRAFYNFRLRLDRFDVEKADGCSERFLLNLGFGLTLGF